MPNIDRNDENATRHEPEPEHTQPGITLNTHPEVSLDEQIDWIRKASVGTLTVPPPGYSVCGNAILASLIRLRGIEGKLREPVGYIGDPESKALREYGFVHAEITRTVGIGKIPLYDGHQSPDKVKIGRVSPKVKFVLADNRSQYLDFIRDKNLSSVEYPYLNSWQQVIGLELSPSDIILLGNSEESKFFQERVRPQIRGIDQALLLRGKP